MTDVYAETLVRDKHGTPVSCKGCRYRKTLVKNRTACHYAIDTGELRGRDVANCSRYESGRRARKRPFHECVDDDYI